MLDTKGESIQSTFASIERESGLAVVYVVDRIDNLQKGLHPEEEALVSKAVEKRRRQFEAGRSAARLGLERLGVPAQAIRRGGMGEPVWPQGVAGSITHTDALAAAAVARRKHIRSLGIDLERADGLAEDLLGQVLTPAELARCKQRKDADVGLLGKAVFCAKEAVYKCVSPTSGELFDFHDVEVELDDCLSRFHATALRPFSGAGLLAHASGYLSIGAHAIAALCCLPAEPHRHEGERCIASPEIFRGLTPRGRRP